MTGKIFFFHNPKAGGVSLRRVFESHFRPEKQCPIIENDKVGHERWRGEYAHFRGYDYYAGHYGRDIFEAVNEGHRCVTNFRHPLARLISLYNFFRFTVKLSEKELGTEQFRAVAFAKSVSFEEFVSSSDPNVDVYVRNAHFRQLAHSCWALETSKEFDDVCRFVDEMPWYYVCEYPALSIEWLRRAFDWDVGHIPRENLTRAQTDQAANLATLDDRIREVIHAKNDLDFTLYRYAVGRLVTRITEPPTLLQRIQKAGRGVSRLLAMRDQNCAANNRASFGTSLDDSIFRSIYSPVTE
jgi:Sulfotransferase family